MDIYNLLKDSRLRKWEFPITAKKVFMAHAAASPLPRRVSTAIQEYVERTAYEGQWEFLYSDIENLTRKHAAAILGADEAEIAFVSSTSMGLSMIASGLSWKKGNNIVVADGDFPSNIYPWTNLRKCGVEIRFIPRHKDGFITVEDVEKIINCNTRLVSLSTVNFVTGYSIDVTTIGRFLRKKGILFCIDAAQSLGALPIDISYVDFLASNAHKWLLGPLGIGILFVAREHLDELHPVLTGWKSVRCKKEYLNYNFCFQDSAQRYEPGSSNAIGLIGLNSALELLLEVGIENIAASISKLRKIIIPSLMDKGYQIIGPKDLKDCSGITSFTSNHLDIARIRQELDESGFIVSLRDSLDGKKCIRISPHFYNTEEEMTELLARLPKS